MAKSTTTPSNLFAKKSVTTATPAAKKDAKPIVKIVGAEFAEAVAALKTKKKEMSNLKTEVALLTEQVKTEGTAQFIRMYAEKKHNPDSFNLQSETGEMVLVMPKDAYPKITPERAEELKEVYGADIVTESTVYKFNPELLEKYAEQLSKLIWSAKFLTTEEKEALVIQETEITVRKGAIDDAMTTGKGNVETYLADINPQIAIK